MTNIANTSNAPSSQKGKSSRSCSGSPLRKKPDIKRSFVQSTEQEGMHQGQPVTFRKIGSGPLGENDAVVEIKSITDKNNKLLGLLFGEEFRATKGNVRNPINSSENA